MKPLLVVDGYNIIGAWPQAQREGWPLDECRDRLIHLLQDYAGYTGQEVWLVFDGYKAARYSKKYLAQHEVELADYRAAKTAMSELLGGAKLPKMDTLKKQRRELSEKKKALYAEYRKAQSDMRQAVAVKANIDHLLGHTDEQKNKAQER